MTLLTGRGRFTHFAAIDMLFVARKGPNLLQIRHNQMQAIGEARLREFERRMIRILIDRYPHRFASTTEGELLRFVRSGMEKAGRYGIRFEGAISRFVECMAWLGADFDTDPSKAWAGRILQRKDIDGSEKMNQIDRYIAFDLRDRR